jgi:hypothetical protein
VQHDLDARHRTGHTGQGRAVEFDSEDDYITLPKRIASYQDVTIATWVYWDGGKDWQRVFDFGGDVTKTLFFTPQSGERDTRFEITTRRGTESTGRMTAPALKPLRWVHVATILKGDLGSLYIDGNPVAAVEITTDPLFTQNHCYVGKSQCVNAPLFKGRLDDLRVYN